MATDPSQKPAFEDLKVGAQVKAFRKAKGFSLSELARITSISEATLSRVENEQRP